MKFEEVLPALKRGKKAKRKAWEKGDYIKKDAREYIKKDVRHVVEEIINQDSVTYSLTITDLEADDWEIVKETKKVKLRDLTPKQFEKYCKNFTGKYTYGTNCDKCVFHNVSCNSWYDSCWIKHKDLYSDKFLDQEIEIED